MNSKIGKRQRQVGIPRKTLLASFLDPRTKELAFFGELDTEKVISMVKSELIEIAEKSGMNNPPNHDPDVDIDTDPVIDSPQLDIFKNLSKRLIPAAPMSLEAEKEMITERVEHELKQYMERVPMMAMKKGKNYSNPLKDFWALRETDFPLLSKLARKILCIPATSAPSERVFSQAGLTITKLRASLTADNASKLIFLHDTWDIAENYQEKRVGLSNEHSNQKQIIEL